MDITYERYDKTSFSGGIMETTVKFNSVQYGHFSVVFVGKY